MILTNYIQMRLAKSHSMQYQKQHSSFVLDDPPQLAHKIHSKSRNLSRWILYTFLMVNIKLLLSKSETDISNDHLYVSFINGMKASPYNINK